MCEGEPGGGLSNGQAIWGSAVAVWHGVREGETPGTADGVVMFVYLPARMSGRDDWDDDTHQHWLDRRQRQVTL